MTFKELTFTEPLPSLRKAIDLHVWNCFSHAWVKPAARKQKGAFKPRTAVMVGRKAVPGRRKVFKDL